MKMVSFVSQLIIIQEFEWVKKDPWKEDEAPFVKVKPKKIKLAGVYDRIE
ncbi:MAG TPA: hypothetical protein VF233_05445 [Nitrososphaeraceae archaeon]